MGWLIAAVILLLIAVLPVGLSVIYDAEGPRIYAAAGLIRLKIFPGKKKESKEESAEKPKKEKKAKPAQKKKTEDKKGGSITDFIPLVRVVLDLLVSFRKKIRVDHLELKLILCGGDPAALAENYGKAWAALGNLMPTLERYFIIKKRDLEVECDFVASETVIKARLDISITVGRILSLVTVYGFRGLREFMKIMKLRKGGA